MAGIQTTITLIEIIVLLGPTMLCLSYGLYQIMWGRSQMHHLKGGTALVAASVLLIILYSILAQLPAFDFVDRCRPDGTGFCADGSTTIEQGRREVQRDTYMSFLLCIILPLVIAVSLALLAMRTRLRPSS